MKAHTYMAAALFALAAVTAHADPPLNCPGNSCGAPGHIGPAPVTLNEPLVGTSVINQQTNAAPVTSIVSGVRVRATAGDRGSARISGNSISATAVGNDSVVRVVRRR